MFYIVGLPHKAPVAEVVCLQEALGKFQIYGLRLVKGTVTQKLILANAASRNDQEAYLVSRYNNKHRRSAFVELYGVTESEVRSY